MKVKKKSAKKIVVILSICIIIIATAAYFLFGNFLKKDFMRNSHFPPNTSNREGDFQSPLVISDEEKTEIASFFGNSPSSSEVEEYCNKNFIYCMYYCKEINPDYNYCKLLNNTQMPPRGESP